MKPKPRDARAVVLESAVRVFARRGYAGTSVDDILDATGLSKPTLYYYFQSKAGLFRAILDFAFEEGFRLMREGVAKAAAKDRGCGGQLLEVAVAWFEFAERHQDLTRLLFACTFAAPEEIPPGTLDAAKRRRNLEFVREIVARGQAAGEFSGGYSDMEITHAFYGAISQQLRTHLLEPRGRLDRRRAARVVGLLLSGAGNPAAGAGAPGNKNGKRK